ncbi:DUF3761 domain-containing protein [Streptomyces sp. NPDC004065]|uniref:DUF3761 domain-containing protein n=1 Tax=Streptomyces sp. NPDC004065 TaxID=3364689 RepID=UPI00384DB2B3
MSSCDDNGGGKKESAAVSVKSDKPTPAATHTTASPTPTKSATPTPAKVTVKVKDYTGKVLQTAQDEAQAQGLYRLASKDLSSLHRHQVLDRDWKVCGQTPSPGAVVDPATKLTFKVVKRSESCSRPDAILSHGSSSSSGGSSSGGSGSSTGGSGSATGGSSSSTGGSSSSTGGSSSSGGGSSSSGGQQAPAGASAICNDGTPSYSAHRRGTCSHHGGVARWLKDLPS